VATRAHRRRRRETGIGSPVDSRQGPCRNRAVASHPVRARERGARRNATIERINPAMEDDPGLMNVAPYTDAWLVVLRPDDMQAAYARLKRGPDAIDALKAWIDKYGLQCMRCSQ
jgi:hypothetical protein